MDVNELSLDGRFDRIVLVEMFEHMRNCDVVLARVAGLQNVRRPALRPPLLPSRARVSVRGRLDGAELLHGGHDALGRPLLHFQEHLRVVSRWQVSGIDYARTAEAWLKRLDENEIAARFGTARRPLAGVLLPCAELWGVPCGSKWLVSHHLLHTSS